MFIYVYIYCIILREHCCRDTPGSTMLLVYFLFGFNRREGKGGKN